MTRVVYGDGAVSGWDAGAVGERFRAQERMMPEGVVFVASWVDAKEMRCFQLMEAPNAAEATPYIEGVAGVAEKAHRQDSSRKERAMEKHGLCHWGASRL